MMLSQNWEPAEPTDYIIVVNNDSEIDSAHMLAKALRGIEKSAEIIASGSPQKRYDKAQNRGPRIICIILSCDKNSAISIDLKRGRGLGDATESDILNEIVQDLSLHHILVEPPQLVSGRRPDVTVKLVHEHL